MKKLIKIDESELEVLNFLYARLNIQYNEKENLDYMRKFKSIILKCSDASDEVKNLKGCNDGIK